MPRWKTKTVEERFFEKIKINEETGCWEWQRSLNDAGYGMFCLDKIMIRAHRASVIMFKHEDIEGKLVCHRCDNRKCVNPAHLFVGSFVDNMQDCKAKHRMSPPPLHFGETHHKAKISEDTVRYIRASNKSYVELSKEVGLSDVQVSKIKRRINWKTVL